MTIQLGGQRTLKRKSSQLLQLQIMLITTHVVSAYSSLDEVSGESLQSVFHRLAALEDRLPIDPLPRYGVTTTDTDGNCVTCYRVQAIDHHGQTVIFYFEQYPALPNTNMPFSPTIPI